MKHFDNFVLNGLNIPVMTGFFLLGLSLNWGRSGTMLQNLSEFEPWFCDDLLSSFSVLDLAEP